MACYCSFAKSCPTLCDRMDCSTPGFPVLHHLMELAQSYVHWVGDAMQPSHPLFSPSPPALDHSLHQGLVPKFSYFFFPSPPFMSHCYLSLMTINVPKMSSSSLQFTRNWELSLPEICINKSQRTLMSFFYSLFCFVTSNDPASYTGFRSEFH